MNALQQVDVSLGDRSYRIHIGQGLLTQTQLLTAQLDGRGHAVIISDDRVAPLLAPALADALRELELRVDVLTIPAGEGSKCLAQAERLWNLLVELSADRRTVIAALGGGVVGDLAGWVAASFGRGLDLLQYPTTLLAQVDSSVGGKVGVNLPSAKNMVGAFWQPRGVVVDIRVLESLPDREYRAGLAEVVKYGVILDQEFFEYLEQNAARINQREPDALIRVVARCCRLKADVVQQDEREISGSRAALNYGHTFGHAIETETQYQRYLHGEAIAIGMGCAARLARSMGRASEGLLRRQSDLLRAFGLPVDMPSMDVGRLMAAMRRDKKASSGQLRFIVPTRIGHVETLGNVEEHFVRLALEPTEP